VFNRGNFISRVKFINNYITSNIQIHFGIEFLFKEVPNVDGKRSTINVFSIHSGNYR